MIRINSVELSEPSGISIDPVEIGAYSRTASGRLVKDVVGVKRIINLVYDVMLPEEMAMLENLFLSGEAVAIAYTEGLGLREITCFIVNMPRGVYVHDQRYYTGVNIKLEEV